MNKRKTLRNIAAVILFSLGALAGLAFFGSAIWANMEAFFYGFYYYGDQSTGAMHCPHIMTENETGVITVSFRNNSKLIAGPLVEMQVSNPIEDRTVDETLNIPPGETKPLQLKVTPADRGYRNFIFIKLVTFHSYPLPDVEQTCGILFLEVPGVTGGEIMFFSIAVSVVGMLVGLGLWSRVNRPLRDRNLNAFRAMSILAAMVFAGILVSFTAFWMVGGALLVVCFLTGLAVVGNFLMFSSPSR